MDNNTPILSQPENGMNSVPQQPLPQQSLPQQPLPQQPAVQGDTPSSSEPMTKKRNYFFTDKIKDRKNIVIFIVIVALLIALTIALVVWIRSLNVNVAEDFFGALIDVPENVMKDYYTDDVLEIDGRNMEPEYIYALEAPYGGDEEGAKNYYGSLDEMFLKFVQKYDSVVDFELMDEFKNTFIVMKNIVDIRVEEEILDKIEKEGVEKAHEYYHANYECKEIGDEQIINICKIENAYYDKLIDEHGTSKTTISEASFLADYLRSKGTYSVINDKILGLIGSLRSEIEDEKN